MCLYFSGQFIMFNFQIQCKEPKGGSPHIHLIKIYENDFFPKFPCILATQLLLNLCVPVKQLHWRIFIYHIPRKKHWSVSNGNLFLYQLEKKPPYGRHFPSSCGEMHPSAATVGPFRPNSGALQAQPKKSVMKFVFRILFKDFFL